MRKHRYLNSFFLILLLAWLAVQTGCREHQKASLPKPEKLNNETQTEVSRPVRLASFKQKLSEYGFYSAPMRELQPADGILHYELNSALFSDYAEKQRLIKLPQDGKIRYRESGVLDFPVGTIIAKTFYYPNESSENSDKNRIIETRILEHLESGWIGIPYVWNADQTDAELSISGATKTISRIDSKGDPIEHEYSVPNFNDCKRCHTGDSTEPIGPKAHNLNRLVQTSGQSQHQLENWVTNGWLEDCPETEQLPRLVAWDDDTQSIDDRARAYLEINCAHCHSATGTARNSGLHLNVEETQPYRLGVHKSPVAAGQGTGGRLYGIVPGKPDESILEHRMRTLKPGEVMPEFGKALVHQEGLQLIREWIAQMKTPEELKP